MGSSIVNDSLYAGSVSELYSRLAWMYDFFTDHEVARHDEAVRIASIKEDDQVLEVACGTGRGTVRIASHSEFTRVLKPGGKIALMNMSKNRAEKTLYENGLLGFASGSCRPVLMQSFLKEAGYETVERAYRKNASYFPLNWLTGTEIVWGCKPSTELTR